MRQKSHYVSLLTVLLLTACAIASVGTPASASPFKVDRELFKLYPSLIVYEKSSAEFTEPQTCGECHEDKYQEWNGSLHSMAFIDPVYQGELNKAVKAVGHEISRQCERLPLPGRRRHRRDQGAGDQRPLIRGQGRSLL